MSHDPPAWRLIRGDDPEDGPTHMAIDQALLASVADGAAPVLRLYRWSPATLSFGRNQPARGLYDQAGAAERGIAFVRRPTGGQAVLHDDELTYAVVAPVEAVGKPRAAYRRINEALVAGLRGLGVDAAVAGHRAGRAAEGAAGTAWESGEPEEPTAWTDACFRRPERGEVVVSGRKLVGSAQRTQSRTILQHGSILLGGTQAPAEALLLVDPAAATDRRGQVRAAPAPAGRGGAAPGRDGGGRSGWTTLDRELGHRPDLDALVSAVVSGFETVLGIRPCPSRLAAVEVAGARELRGGFASSDWTWRR